MINLFNFRQKRVKPTNLEVEGTNSNDPALNTAQNPVRRMVSSSVRRMVSSSNKLDPNDFPHLTNTPKQISKDQSRLNYGQFILYLVL